MNFSFFDPVKIDQRMILRNQTKVMEFKGERVGLGAHEKNRTSDLSLTKGVLYH